jgi:hypothetical protein
MQTLAISEAWQKAENTCSKWLQKASTTETLKKIIYKNLLLYTSFVDRISHNFDAKFMSLFSQGMKNITAERRFLNIDKVIASTFTGYEKHRS